MDYQYIEHPSAQRSLYQSIIFPQAWLFGCHRLNGLPLVDHFCYTWKLSNITFVRIQIYCFSNHRAVESLFSPGSARWTTQRWLPTGSLALSQNGLLSSPWERTLWSEAGQRLHQHSSTCQIVRYRRGSTSWRHPGRSLIPTRPTLPRYCRLFWRKNMISCTFHNLVSKGVFGPSEPNGLLST